MRGPSWENLDDFLQLDTNGGFATPAVLQFQHGGTRSVVVLFDDPYLNAQLGEYEMDTSTPRISGKESDFAGLQRGDVVLLDGEEFDVMSSPEGDGQGWAMVKLARP